MKRLMLFEDFNLSGYELKDHSDKINKIISKKEYFVTLMENGKKVEKKAEVKLNYDSSNTEENSSMIKVFLGVGKFLELKTYMGQSNKKELSVYKNWGIVLDDISIEKIVNIYEDIKDYVGLSESDVSLINKALNTRLRNEENNLSFEIKLS
jgi:hypothetical protein